MGKEPKEYEQELREARAMLWGGGAGAATFLSLGVIGLLYADALKWLVEAAAAVGGIGTAAGIFVALYVARAQQINAWRLAENARDIDAEIEAFNLRANLTPALTDIVAIRKSLLQRLCQPAVDWEFSFNFPFVRDDPEFSVRTLAPLAGGIAQKLTLNVELRALLRRDKNFFAALVDLQRSVEEAREYFGGRPETIVANVSPTAVVELVIRMCISYARVSLWLTRNFDVSLRHQQQFEGQYLEVNWPSDEELLRLARENPPRNWGVYEERARDEWNGAGETGVFPIRTSS